MSDIAIVSAYVVAFFGACFLWWRQHWPFPLLLFVVVMLGLSGSAFALQRHDTILLRKQSHQACEDRKKMAETIDSFHIAAKSFMLASAQRLAVEIKQENSGPARTKNIQTRLAYLQLASSLKTVYVEECKLKVSTDG